MINSIRYVCFSFAISSYNLFALDSIELKQSANDIVEAIVKINSPLNTPINCSAESSVSKIKKCSEVTNDFCRALWSPENNGSLLVYDGQVLSGASEKSDLSLSVIENNKALINSEANLPDDLRLSLSPLLKKLAAHLKEENNSNKWSRDYSKIKTEIQDALEDVTDARFDKKKLPVFAKDFIKFNAEQRLIYKAEQNKVQDDLTIAKYSKNSNWLRVEKMFPEIQRNLINTIDKLNIPNNLKEKMKIKLASVKLSLPLRDPAKSHADGNCASSENNAFYSPTTNYFTVCAGLFNQYQSESSLAFVIGHELSHAIDSERRADDAFQESALTNSLNQLINKSQQVYGCNEWKKISNDIKNKASDFFIQNDPLEKFYSCLRGNKNLEEMSLENISKASEMMTRSILSFYATENYFSKLLEKTTMVDKEIRSNEFYYRPDLLMASLYGYIGTNTQTRDVSSAEIFMQNFYCNLEEMNVTKESFDKLDKELRARIFKNSIDQTFQLTQAQMIEYSKYCGKNCAGLTQFNLSMNPQEQVADWLSGKAFEIFLMNIPQKNRAQASALTTTLFCPRGIEATDLATTEKEFSLEEHPDDTNRRMSVYTPVVADLVGCQIDESLKGDSQCNP